MTTFKPSTTNNNLWTSLKYIFYETVWFSPSCTQESQKIGYQLQLKLKQNIFIIIQLLLKTVWKNQLAGVNIVFPIGSKYSVQKELPSCKVQKSLNNSCFKLMKFLQPKYLFSCGCSFNVHTHGKCWSLKHKEIHSSNEQDCNCQLNPVHALPSKSLSSILLAHGRRSANSISAHLTSNFPWRMLLEPGFFWNPTQAFGKKIVYIYSKTNANMWPIF